MESFYSWIARNIRETDASLYIWAFVNRNWNDLWWLIPTLTTSSTPQEFLDWLCYRTPMSNIIPGQWRYYCYDYTWTAKVPLLLFNDPTYWLRHYKLRPIVRQICVRVPKTVSVLVVTFCPFVVEPKLTLVRRTELTLIRRTELTRLCSFLNVSRPCMTVLVSDIMLVCFCVSAGAAALSPGNTAGVVDPSLLQHCTYAT